MTEADCTVQQGRPKDAESRIAKERETYDRLDKLGINYSRVDHASADTIEQCAQIGKVLGAPICKNLFLCNTQKTTFYLLLMPGDKPFKTKLLSPQLGCSRLSFAPAEYMEQLINCTAGSASVLGLFYDRECRVQLLMDKDLLNEKYFGCHPCVNTSSIGIETSQLLERILPACGHSPIFVEL